MIELTDTLKASGIQSGLLVAILLLYKCFHNRTGFKCNLCGKELIEIHAEQCTGEPQAPRRTSRFAPARRVFSNLFTPRRRREQDYTDPPVHELRVEVPNRDVEEGLA